LLAHRDAASALRALRIAGEPAECLLNDLQDLVDGLALILRGPVGVDDRRLRSVAYSAHVDGIDRVRLASILQREPPGEVAAWLDDLGIRRADPFVRLPANPGLGMAARVCVPLRFDDRLLGFLWLIDEPSSLTPEDLDRALAAAGDIALALFRATADQDSDREEERRLLRSALGLTSDNASRATAAMLGEGRLASTRYHAVLAISVSTGGAPSDDLVQARIAAAVEHERRFAGPGEFLVLVHGERVLALMGVNVEQDALTHAERVAARAEHNLSGARGHRAVAGISAIGQRLDDLPAARREAELTAAVCARIHNPPSVALWDELGASRILAQVVDVADPSSLLPESFRALIAHPDSGSLVPTLEAFLEAGGDARGAAERLYIHRSSLYKRLRRIESVCGLDLATGDARLELHLAIRLWRLAGGSTRVDRG
jgi:sugar diacid utilization regulator